MNAAVASNPQFIRTHVGTTKWMRIALKLGCNYELEHRLIFVSMVSRQYCMSDNNKSVIKSIGLGTYAGTRRAAQGGTAPRT